MSDARPRDQQLFHVWLPKSLHRAFKARAAMSGMTMRTALIKLLERFVANERKAA
jgi:hypothetical protein